MGERPPLRYLKPTPGKTFRTLNEAEIEATVKNNLTLAAALLANQPVDPEVWKPAAVALAPPPPKRARTTTLRRAWSLQLKACVDAAVTLFDDGRRGLVASHGRDLVCFDTRNGKALWTARVALGESLAGEADAAVEAPCLIVDGTAFVGGYDGRVYAVAVADGTLRWTSAPCAGPIKGAATALDATTLVVGSHGGFVRALTLADGSVRRTSEHLAG